MKMNRSLRKLLSTIGTIVAVAVVAYLQYKEEEGQGSRGGKNLPPVNIPSASGETQNGYTLIDGCTLIEDRGNDGDSFLLKTPTGERLHLRLYFADCAEKYRHQHNGDRIREQGRDFGGLSENQTIQVGKDAKALVENSSAKKNSKSPPNGKASTATSATTASSASAAAQKKANTSPRSSSAMA